MSTRDDWEANRGPVYRRSSRPRPKRPDRRETQLTLKLIGGTTASDKGLPFDDDFSHIGRAPTGGVGL